MSDHKPVLRSHPPDEAPGHHPHWFQKTPDELIAAGFEPIGHVVDPIGLADYYDHFVVLDGNMCWVKK